MNIISDNYAKPTQKVASSGRRGGLKTMPFIIANEALEKIAAYGLQPNMILYLITSYNFSVASGTSALFIWGAVSNFMPILGAFLSDSYFGRFIVISVATFVMLMGLVVMWLTAIIQKARPPPCDPTLGISCIKPKAGQYAFLFLAFALMSIGAGGIRPCSMAFGADQLENPQNPNNQRVIQSFFNWYYASVAMSLMIAITVIVYIQTEWGWIVGFGVPVALMLLSAVMFFLGSRLYVKVKPNKSLLTGLVQVLVACWKKRHIKLPGLESCDGVHYYQDEGSKLVTPTNKLRYLNKACLVQNPGKELNADGSASDPWSLCSVLQVEVLKSLIKLLPMWSTGIMIGVTINQHSFPVLQARTLDRRLIGGFEIPAASFGLFAILTLSIWLALYDRVVIPLLSKHTKNPRGIGVKTRIGVGLFISCLATGTAALVERTRRGRAIHQGFTDTPKSQVDMSAMWLIPQHCLTGLAEAFNAIGQIELYYSQFPKSMASIAVALFALGMAFANLIGSLIVTIVNNVSKKGGRESWVSSNLNKGHYDYYYWVLTILSLVNFMYFYFVSRSYKSCEEKKVWDEDVADKSVSMESSSIYFSA